ncbi:MAG TPA: hypothetical protein VMB50_08380, partial [Myxococcales bacterium]|nr:hypothetical protein [Myxococcales bacterium]
QDDRRDEQWDRAKSEYEQAIKLDPINMDARKGLKDVEREIETKQFIDRAKQRIDVGQDEDGVELYLKVDADSIYFPRAQAEIHRLASLLTRRYVEKCHGAVKSGDPSSIVESCGHYLNLTCNIRADEEVLKQVRTAEKKLGPKLKGEPWSCSSSYSWVSQDTSAQAASLDSRIAKKYPDQRLAENVRIYANGQAKEALTGLDNLKEVPAEAHNPDLAKLVSNIELAYGFYADGVSSLQVNDVRNARAHWQNLFDADKQIMPDGFQSELVTQARQQLSHEYLKLGQGLFNQERYVEAFQQYQQGFQVLPGDTDIQQAIRDLEQVAYKIVGNPKDCQQLRDVLNMTVGDPSPSLAHKQAIAIGKQNKCRGF